jgi:hypothetical protein
MITLTKRWDAEHYRAIMLFVKGGDEQCLAGRWSKRRWEKSFSNPLFKTCGMEDFPSFFFLVFSQCVREGSAVIAG